MTGWNRVLWAVEFSSPLGDPLILGQGWDRDALRGPCYPDEPPRALVFCTRKSAREWCKQEEAKYEGRTDCCADWRFRAVKVTEKVERVK